MLLLPSDSSYDNIFFTDNQIDNIDTWFKYFIAKTWKESHHGRILLPIADQEATATYYLICRQADKKRFAPLFKEINKDTIS